MRKQFGDRLKELRICNELTQEELAKHFNTGKSSISNYEKNTRLPDANTIEKYADYFNVSVDYILGKTDIKNKDIMEKDLEKINKFMEDNKEYFDIMKKIKDNNIDLSEVDEYIEFLISKKNR